MIDDDKKNAFKAFRKRLKEQVIKNGTIFGNPAGEWEISQLLFKYDTTTSDPWRNDEERPNDQVLGLPAIFPQPSFNEAYGYPPRMNDYMVGMCMYTAFLVIDTILNDDFLDTMVDDILLNSQK
jgi:hypothetical protein